MTNDFKIGTSNLNGGSAKERWFLLKANTDNPFRVLPPLHSLADSGNFAKYYAVHKVYIKNLSDSEAKGSFYSFQCLQRKDKQTQQIVTRCPFCDQHAAMKVKYEEAKAKGATKEQLSDFYKQQVLPYQPDKKFYVNAVNLEGKVSVLPITITGFRSLQDRIRMISDTMNGFDVTGLEGAYLNFRKIQKFQGDRDTTYTVDKWDELVNIDGSQYMSLKKHMITDDFIKYLKDSSRDLGELFKTITSEEMVSIISTGTDLVAKKAVMDSIFPTTNSSNNRSVPTVPDVIAPTTGNSVDTTISSNPVGVSEVVAPKTPTSSSSVTLDKTVSKKETPVASTSQLSDEEFVNFFGPQE